jgi:hypothetical protein
VPQVTLACGRVGDDGDGMAAQPGRPALKLLSGPTACMGRQLVYLHGAGNRFPTRRGGGIRAPGLCCMPWPRLQSESGELARDEDLSCEAGTCWRGSL